jgi:cysteate synthase
MLRAWEKNSRSLFPEDLDPMLILRITTRVLSTRYPAYSVTGGVYDALTATGGRMYGVENEAVYAAMDTFRVAEGIDIVPASGVAVAVLAEAVRTGAIGKSDTILLNITGGGEERLRKEKKTWTVVPRYVKKAITEKEIEELLCSFLKKSS